MKPIDIITDLGIITTGSGHRKRFVIAKCPCGKVFKVALNALKTGNTKSCGCGINRQEPLYMQPEYRKLCEMKKRCHTPNFKYYYLYGGRGIKVCNEWLNDSWSFVKWARKNGFKKGLYIDRIDPNGDYTPENCRFVTPLESAKNKRLLSKSNTSGYRGVSKHIKRDGRIKWRSRITVNKQIISLGIYDSPKLVANAYDNYVIENNTGHLINCHKEKDGLNLQFNDSPDLN